MKKNVPKEAKALFCRVLLKTLLVMKVAMAIILFTAFQVKAGNASGQIISLDLKNTDVRSVLTEIEKSTRYRFLYNYELSGLKTKLDFNAQSASVNDVLNKLLTGNNLTYKKLNRNLIAIVSTIDAEKRQVQITGKITNDKNEPIAGASVTEKGTANGVATNDAGEYSITVGDAAVLVISAVGYQTQEIIVGNRASIDVRLVAAIASLDEVVVVGYGTQKKSVVTGAISSVKSKDLEDMPAPRLEDVLKGRTSGVTVASNSGQPGTQSSVMIRGITSINNFDPLYVVDGVPVGGGIDYLNAGNIESVEVLKDAASAAIYGTKAASGVILVTTKKGKSGSFSVNLNGYYGTQAPARKLHLLNATEYATLRNESALAAGKGLVYANPESLGKGTDWQSVIFDDHAKIQNYELGMSGGNEKSTFFASFGYFDQDGIVMPSISNYKRFSIRVNSEHKLKSWLKFGESVSYARTKSQSGFDANGYFGGPLSSAVNLDPITPAVVTDPELLKQSPYSDPTFSKYLLRDANGNPYGISQKISQDMTNPLAYAKRVEGNFGWGDKFVGNAYFEIEPIKDLRIRSNFGADLAFWGGESFTPLYYMSSTQSNMTNTSFNRSMNRALNWVWTNTASYSKTIDKHNATLLVGTEARKNQGIGVNGTYIGLPANTFGDASMNFKIAPSNTQAGGYEYQPYNISSLFARLNYDYDGKYLLTAVFRRDGSSHFGSNNVYGNFPSVSVGWIPSRESFWGVNNDAISYLKIRAGYGVNGNDNLDAFRYVSTIGAVGTYPIGGIITTGNAPLAPANPDLKWEQTSQLNFGFDMSFLRGFTATVDVFKKKTTGMLMQIKLPGYVGASNQPWGNIASMENKGVEGEIGYAKSFGDFGLDLKANASYIENKVTDIGDNNFITYANFQASSYEVSRKVVGQPINEFYGFKHLGIFQTQDEINNYVDKNGQKIQPDAKPGDFKWADINDNGRIDDADRTYLGNPTPNFMYGFTIGANYKGFDLKIFSQGVSGNKIFQQLRRLDIQDANYSTAALNRWTGPGTSNSYPRLVDDDPSHNFSYPSDFYLEDGAYFRIKTLQLGYNIPLRLLEKANIKNARVYVSGNNLLTFTKYTGYDPEIGGTGGGWLFSIDRGIYPQARSYMVGVNLTF
ncbi:MAG: TonB-dependent receptor [Niabella sp.]